MCQISGLFPSYWCERIHICCFPLLRCNCLNIKLLSAHVFISDSDKWTEHWRTDIKKRKRCGISCLYRNKSRIQRSKISILEVRDMPESRGFAPDTTRGLRTTPGTQFINFSPSPQCQKRSAVPDYTNLCYVFQQIYGKYRIDQSFPFFLLKLSIFLPKVPISLPNLFKARSLIINIGKNENGKVGTVLTLSYPECPYGPFQDLRWGTYKMTPKGHFL